MFAPEVGQPKLLPTVSPSSLSVRRPFEALQSILLGVLPTKFSRRFVCVLERELRSTCARACPFLVPRGEGALPGGPGAAPGDARGRGRGQALPGHVRDPGGAALPAPAPTAGGLPRHAGGPRSSSRFGQSESYCASLVVVRVECVHVLDLV